MFRRFALVTGLAVAAVAATSSVRAAEPVGVAACDEFLTKYEACVGTKVPAAQQTMFKGQMEQTRKSWTDLAKSPNGKSSLEAACKQTAQQMKTSLSAYGCSF